MDLYEKVLAEVLAGAQLTPVLFGSAPNTAGSAEHTVRVSLETAYRTLGRAAEDAEKIRLIDAANTVRPRTLT